MYCAGYERGETGLQNSPPVQDKAVISRRVCSPNGCIELGLHGMKH